MCCSAPPPELTQSKKDKKEALEMIDNLLKGGQFSAKDIRKTLKEGQGKTVRLADWLAEENRRDLKLPHKAAAVLRILKKAYPDVA